MKNYVQCLALAGSLATLCFVSPAAQAKDVPAADKEFVMMAAQGGMTEVELGKMAGEKGSSTEVKDFGSKMVADHGMANEELKTIATGKGLTVPDKLDAKHQMMVDKLSKMSGAEFDKAYVADMVKGHKMTDALMKKEAKSGKDEELKAFASKTDQTVEMHLKMIEDIQSKMK